MSLYPLLVPAGNDTEVQYNDGGLFGGDSTFTFDDSAKTVYVRKLRITDTSGSYWAECRMDGGGNVEFRTLSGAANDLFSFRGSNPSIVFKSDGANDSMGFDFNQTTTRRAQFQYQDTNDRLVFKSHYGLIEFATDTTGTAITRMSIDPSNPYVSLINTTEEDADGGRESRLIFKGEQSGGEQTTLAWLQASHNGSSDDEKGQLQFYTNDGSDGDTPTLAMTIDENQWLGLGTDTPQYGIHQIGQAFVQEYENSFSTIETWSYGGVPHFVLRRAEGTRATPTIVADDDVLGRFQVRGHDGNSFQDAAEITICADGVVAAGDMPGRLQFGTTPAGATESSVRMVIDNAGKVVIGAVTPLALFHVTDGTIAPNDWHDAGFDKFLFVGTDFQFALVDTDSGSWGASMAFRQVDGNVYENQWTMIRQTNGDGTGDGSLRYTYGTNIDPTANPSLIGFATDGSLDGSKFKLTAIGGLAIKLTNTTGVNTVQGQTVKADTATDDAVILTAADDTECFGVFLDSGVADDAEAWVVVAGIADVAMEDNTAATHGNWVETSDAEAGYGNAESASPVAAPQHFNEIGHCIESVTADGEGTHILARCVLHFN